LLGTVVALVVAAPVANAKANTETIHFKGVTEMFSEDDPCLGPTDFTITYNGVVHTTETGNSFHITGTFAGTFVADPQDPELATYTGHFAQWFGGNENNHSFNTTFTFAAVGKGDDGSRIRFQEVAHITVNGNGQVTVEFDKLTCA
jgi:hypothetical protein